VVVAGRVKWEIPENTYLASASSSSTVSISKNSLDFQRLIMYHNTQNLTKPNIWRANGRGVSGAADARVRV